jgi:membrane fusion protein (multidrug efflux system)
MMIILAVITVVVGSFGGIKWWVYRKYHVTTDNAYVKGDIVLISSRIPGTVIDVLVEDNWHVMPGQVLVKLDPKDYEVKLREREANLKVAIEEIDRLYAAVEAAEAKVNLAKSQYLQARLDLNRAKTLYEKGVASREIYDHADTDFKVAESRLKAALEELKQAKAALGGELNSERYDRSIVQRALAQKQEAELNLSYTIIKSPVEGYVTRKTVEIGHRVQPGQPLMAVVGLDDVWIEANYKETQLTHVRIGQPVEIEADIYPGYVYQGKVHSISPGTGAVFSLLPPENATGNWVKVVQRVPVKIVLNKPLPPDKPLRLGLSVIATIDTHKRDGLLLLPPTNYQ